ncbi:intradiol ring-cleavage dioxygenase [Nonomuraea zeae]|uniref:Intradiol ring-cleavage dioxygenase n=1 Tax=Nonomuraea zeae TaxID=1642303 RepID=A0A5S4GS75_9ACTN|nr:intradiol ring-cleavage dioxygenase [Nonomuraea zeae]TMR35371.1 intradiol ring-cleavage dioxygenase [Nonomuraea zeae]
MGHDHEGQRVSRRRLISGVSSLTLGGLLASPSARAAGTTPPPPTDLKTLLAKAGRCSLTSATTQGPFYFDADKIRSDIREDKQGARLRLAIKVQDSEGCRPLRDAVVEIWHCDAQGLYSGAEAESKSDATGPPTRSASNASAATPVLFVDIDKSDMADLKPTDDTRYLRGAQVTDGDGVVQFTTIWPGWYPGRTVHIHAMVHSGDQRVLGTQLMFDEALNAEVLAKPPYAGHKGRKVYNRDDGIFHDSMLVRVARDGDGYLGAIVLSADSDKDGG